MRKALWTALAVALAVTFTLAPAEAQDRRPEPDGGPPLSFDMLGGVLAGFHENEAAAERRYSSKGVRFWMPANIQRVSRVRDGLYAVELDTGIEYRTSGELRDLPRSTPQFSVTCLMAADGATAGGREARGIIEGFRTGGHAVFLGRLVRAQGRSLRFECTDVTAYMREYRERQAADRLAGDAARGDPAP
jgi:hypothetical protein